MDVKWTDVSGINIGQDALIARCIIQRHSATSTCDTPCIIVFSFDDSAGVEQVKHSSPNVLCKRCRTRCRAVKCGPLEHMHRVE